MLSDCGKHSMVTVQFNGAAETIEASSWDFDHRCKMLQMRDMGGIIHSYPTHQIRKFKVTPIKDDKNGN